MKALSQILDKEVTIAKMISKLQNILKIIDFIYLQKTKSLILKILKMLIFMIKRF